MADNALTEKMGPLPMWGWMAAISGLALVVYFIRKKKAATPDAAASQQLLAAEEAAAANAAAVTTPNYNYGNGASQPHQHQYSPAASTTTPPPGVTPLPATTPPPVQGLAPAPVPVPAKPENTEVTVTKWPSNSPNAWSNTLWGIATHYKVPGGYMALAKLNGIKNPNLVYPGQKIKIPATAV